MKSKNTILFCVLLSIAIGVGLKLADHGSAERVNQASHDPVAPASNAKGAAAVSRPAVALDAKPAPEPARSVFGPALQWGLPMIPEKTPARAKADLEVIATARLAREILPALSQWKKGEVIAFAVSETPLRGRVQSTFPERAGSLSVGGGLIDGSMGEFSFRQDVKTGEWFGHILDRTMKVAYQIVSSGTGVIVHKKPLSAAICIMPRSPDWKPSPLAAAGSPVAAMVVPNLDSRPTARGVIYLDFDGETVTDPDWASGNTIIAAPAVIGYPAVAMTSAQIQDVWQRVVEDFRAFDVTVTTIRTRYDAAPVGERARAIITPTDGWYTGSAGGVAFPKSYRGSYDGWDPMIPCWIWNNSTAAIMAMTISHEVGHMLNLSHDGTSVGGNAYYSGHDSGVRGWGALMGAPFGKALTQWSKGEYPDANNVEDDFAVAGGVIAEAGHSTGFTADDVGDTIATAKTLSVLPTFSDGGEIGGVTDVDVFGFKSSAGPFTVTVLPQAVDANADLELALLDSTGTQISSSTPLTTSTGAQMSGAIATVGQYYLTVKGRGQPAGLGVVGYPAYGSVGIYTITGTYVPLPEAPVITRQPVGAIINQGQSVTLSCAALSNSPVTYQWYKKISGQPDLLLTGKTSSSLGLSNIQPSSLGDYFVRCRNTTGSTDSNVVTVEVRYKPVITQQPLPAKQGPLPTGAVVTYTVVAHGTAPLTYQWKKNNVIMSGETSATLALGAVDWFDAASYAVVITNPMGSVTSSSAALTVSSAPIFTTPLPANKYLALGGSGSVKVAAVGSGSITYEWYQNGVKITSGVNKTSFSWSGVKATAAGNYFVRLISTFGSVDSSLMVVEVQDKPVIDLNPVATLTAQADQNVTLSCAAHGTDTLATPLTYQWQLNNVNIIDGNGYSGATTNSLTMNPVHWRHRGTYRCVVANAVGTATTKNCAFSVVSYPVILTQPPVFKKIAKNGSSSISVVAGGTGSLKYQWFKDDVAILKATGPSLSLSKATVATTNGAYKVTVTTTTAPMPGTVTSTPCAVTVEDPPVPGPVLSSLSRFNIGFTEPVTFSVNALGSPTLRYQWQKNNVDLVGQTNSTLLFANPQFTDAGAYRVKVTNDVGSVFSSAATVKILNKPVISQQPASLSLFEYDTAVFTTAATGTGPFTYQWYFNGNAITTNSSAKSATLTVSAIRIVTTTGGTNVGNYHVVVSNGAGSATSNTVTLAVNAVPAPTLTDVRPLKVAQGDKIMITGTNLNWINGATISGKSMSVVKVRSTEAAVVLPASLFDPVTSGPLVIKTLGGTVTWPTPITVVKDGSECDDFLNAKILQLSSGAYFLGKADNTLATWQADDPFYYQGKTIWFRWTATKTGTITLRSTSTAFHNEGAVYLGPHLPSSTSSISHLGWFSYHKGDIPGEPTSYDFNVIKDYDYYFIMDSAHPSSSSFSAPNQGNAHLRVTVNANAPRVLAASDFEPASGFVAGASLEGQLGWHASGAEASVQSQGAGRSEATLGGTAVDALGMAWHLTGDDASGGDVISVAADITVSPQANADEKFMWGLYDDAGEPAVLLVFDGKTSDILTLPWATTVQTPSQKFVPGTRCSVVFSIDKASGKWSISLNGSTIAAGDKWVAPASGLARLGASWQPAPGSASGGHISFDNVIVNVFDGPSESSPPAPAVLGPERTSKREE